VRATSKALQRGARYSRGRLSVTETNHRIPYTIRPGRPGRRVQPVTGSRNANAIGSISAPSRPDRVASVRQVGYGLSNVAAHFGIEYQAHDALDDARCAGLLLLRAIAETGLSPEQWMPARTNQFIIPATSIRLENGQSHAKETATLKANSSARLSLFHRIAVGSSPRSARILRGGRVPRGGRLHKTTYHHACRWRPGFAVLC